MSKPYAQLRAQMSPQAQAQAWAQAQALGRTTMTRIAASDISLTLQVTAAMCRCDLQRLGLCPQCECLMALADAVLAYDDRYLMQQNREVRGVVD